MSSLRPNLVKRIERLPKPTNASGAMQPLFEAISNAIHSTQGKFGERVSRRGRVVVTVNTDRRKDHVWATVEDNGLGLDDTNWNAFLTTDTDNKVDIGGKGIGRLLWLDCFENIEINSVFDDGQRRKRRRFRFALAMEEQIQDLRVTSASEERSTSFFVRFSGLRDNGYRERFPVAAISSFNILHPTSSPHLSAAGALR